MSIHHHRPGGVIDVVEAGQLDLLPPSLNDRNRAGTVIGFLAVPGSTLVAHRELADGQARHWPLVFAMALPNESPRFVTVEPSWPDGLPTGRQGALALAEAIRDGISRAFPPGRPDLIPLVAAVGDRAFAIVWSGAVQSRVTVGPVLDNPGFDLLARAGTHPSVGAESERAISPGPPAPPALALVASGVAMAVSVAAHSPIGAVCAVFLGGIGLAGLAR
ncbi:MAG: hypothetical protein JWL70_3025 [Acidimicrobiia bacterium]|nr:hypothetical protein [Acidimicrobiia bacterium]